MVLTSQQFEALMPDATQLDSDEPEMESSLHYMQLLLLVTCLEWLWRDREDFFIGANLTIYFSR
ncbi:Uma2 family endonuclease, partial [Lyngbya sp. CCY1209]